MSTPQEVAMADQALACVASVERICGGNSHLIEDRDLDGLVLEALRGGPSIECLDQEVLIGPVPMRLSPKIFRRRPYGSCDRCLGEWDGTGGRVLDLPAGASIVRVRCCPACVIELNAGFSSAERPITWN